MKVSNHKGIVFVELTVAEMLIALIELEETAEPMGEEEFDRTDDLRCLVEPVRRMLVVVNADITKYKLYELQVSVEDFINTLVGGDFQ